MNPLLLARIGIGVASVAGIGGAVAAGNKAGEEIPKELRNTAITLGIAGLVFLYFTRKK